MAENTKKQDLATSAELTLEEKINKIKSREITEAEKNMLTLPAFEAACEAVKKVTQETGLIYSKYFSDHTGNKIYFKPENMQLTGAYKLRGAYYTIGTLTEEERQRGLITASAGNHAQGVAYAGAVLWCKGCYRHADDHTADQGRAYKGLWCRSGSLR